MNKPNRCVWSACTAIVLLVLVGEVYGAENGYPVAGTAPDQRPAGAPVIQTVEKTEAWYKKALTGINPPYPQSLRFLDDQGNWYTPFDHPGMTGRYDIRNWHSSNDRNQ